MFKNLPLLKKRQEMSSKSIVRECKSWNTRFRVEWLMGAVLRSYSVALRLKLEKRRRQTSGWTVIRLSKRLNLSGFSGKSIYSLNIFNRNDILSCIHFHTFWNIYRLKYYFPVNIIVSNMAHIQFFISNLMVYKSIIVESLNAFTGDVKISWFKFTGCYNPPPPPFTN